MFSVFEGPAGSPRNYLTRHVPPDARTHWIQTDPRFEVTHLLMRRLLPQLRARFGDRPVEAALTRHAPALSMAFLKLDKSLSPSQREQRQLLCARLDSNITHNLTLAMPFITHCCEAIVELLDGEPLTLVIPDVTPLDWCSQQILKILYKDFAAARVDCILGFSPQPTAMEDNGIVFRYSTPVVKSFIYSFRNVPEFSVSLLDAVEETPRDLDPLADLSMARLVDRYDDDLEQKALEIAHAGQAAEGSNPDLLARVMESSFESYGYTTALFLGTKLLESGARLSPRELARIHGIVALTAHNRQFFAEGNQQLAEFLRHNYAAALANETDEAHRVCLHYRLAVTHARRKRETEPAAVFVRDGLRALEASSIEEPQRSLLDGWLRNIHSFVLMQQRNFALAVEEHEVAFGRLTAMEPAGLWANEIKFSAAVLAENLGLLFNLAGDSESSRHWYGVEERLSKKWPALAAVPSAEWQNFFARNFMLRDAAVHAEKGLVKAAAIFQFNLEYFFILTLADLYFRMGAPGPSLIYFERAADLQEKSESSYGTPYLLRGGAAAIAIKAGEAERAQAQLDRLAGESLDLPSRCRVHCLQAAVHALRGDSSRAENTMNEAIEMAVDHGEQNLLVQVATRAGEICAGLSQDEAAAEAFAQGWDLSGLGGENPPNLQPATSFAITMGMLNSGQGDEALLARAIALAPLALTRSREPWWLLPDLARHVNAFAARSPEVCEVNGEALEKVRVAASQRDDCLELIQSWTTQTVQVN